MRTSIPFALVGAVLATSACTTNNTTTTTATPSANAVIPSAGFIGRHLRVEISGDNTTWDETSTVDFGAGVTVGAITVASPTDLFAEITIDPTAAAGMRDVKVTGGGDVTLMQAFELDNPVTLDIQGTVAQGSIALFTLTNHDFDNPFDATSTGDGFFTPIVYTNLAVNGPTGATFNVGNVSPFSATGTLLLDTNAAPGAVSIVSGPSGGTTVTSPSGDLTVATRTATALTAGTAMTTTVAKAFDSQLYSFSATPTGTGLAQFGATTTSSAAMGLTVFLLPASGAWADATLSGASVNDVISTPTMYYAVTLDTSGASGFQYAVKANTISLTKLTETEPNDTVATAQVGTLPALYTGATGLATLSSATDIDYIKVNVPVGKSVHVITLSTDPQTDTWIDVLNSTGTTSIGGPSDDAVYLDEFVSSPVSVTGTYLVKIYASSMFVAADNTYEAAIFLE